MTTLLLTTDINGKVTYGIVPSDDMVSGDLAADTAASFTVPTGFKFYELIFSFQPGLRVWVSFDGQPAEYPADASFSATNSELNPAVRTVAGGTVVSLVTPDTNAMVGVSIYGIR